MLSLSFFVGIGVMLVCEGIDQHASKNIIYSCLAFSLIVELLNIRVRNNQQKKYLKLNPDLNKDLSLKQDEE